MKPASQRITADRLSRATRPLVWLGGGARAAANAVARLVKLECGIITSVQGRGIVAEDVYQTGKAMLVAVDKTCWGSFAAAFVGPMLKKD